MSNIVAPPDAQLTQTPTLSTLNTYVGKHIKDICECQLIDDSLNHCAHFVSHAMGFHFGYTCKHQTGKGEKGASIRVHELFAKCSEVGNWSDLKAASCLVFVIASSNVKLESKVMTNVPQKHVGIYISGTIWHYSNSRDKVVTQTPEAFGKHYPGTKIALFYGTFPL
jgi:hypothetical protein